MGSQVDAAVMINAKRQIVGVANPELFGYEPAELDGQDVEVLVPDNHKDAHPSWVEKFFADFNTVKHLGGGGAMARMVVFLRKDGREIPANISIMRVVHNDQIGVAWVSARAD